MFFPGCFSVTFREILLPSSGKDTLPDDGRSISRNVVEKQYDSRHDKLKDSMNYDPYDND